MVRNGFGWRGLSVGVWCPGDRAVRRQDQAVGMTPQQPQNLEGMNMKTITPRLIALALFASWPAAHAAAAGPAPGAAEAAKWCDAKPGATREQLLALMGKPVTTLDTQLIGAAPPLRFVAFLD